MSEVRTANFETRQATVLAEGMSIILRDKFPPAVVHQVLLGLEEYLVAMPPELRQPLDEA